MYYLKFYLDASRKKMLMQAQNRTNRFEPSSGLSSPTSYILSGDLFGTCYPFVGGEENVPRPYGYRCDIRTGLSIANMTKNSGIQCQSSYVF